MLSFVRCWIVYYSLIYSPVHTQQTFESYITLTKQGTTFVPEYSSELPLKSIYVSSRIRCAMQCNENTACRTFVYDKNTSYCQLYQSDLTNGNITSSSSATSRVGYIQYSGNLYTNYNKTCDNCQYNRYLTCQNTTCQCASATTYWDTHICTNKLFYGDICNNPSQCRSDLNLTCVVGSCQSTPPVCPENSTIIIFDDIPSILPGSGNIPSVYKGLNWINGHYLNVSSGFIGSGYPFACVSGDYLGFLGPNLTIQSLILSNTFTFNSGVFVSAWLDSLVLTIAGYYYTTQLYTYTVPLTTHTRTVLELNWSGLNTIVFSPSGSGYLDVGMDNLCITL